MIRIMVAEDNISTNQTCCKFLTKDKNIQLISSTTDGEKTLKEYLRLRPDVLLLDLNLPKINGLEIINALCEIQEELDKCNIIIISDSELPITNLSNPSKIYRILKKPFSYDTLLNLVKEIEIKNSTFLSDNIRELLYKLKFNLYTEGTGYFVSAIKLAYTNPHLLNTTKDLYKEIAQKKEVTEEHVEWGIRSSVRTMNKYVTEETLKDLFPWHDEKKSLSSKYLIVLFIDYLKIHKT